MIRFLLFSLVSLGAFPALGQVMPDPSGVPFYGEAVAISEVERHLLSDDLLAVASNFPRSSELPRARALALAMGMALDPSNPLPVMAARKIANQEDPVRFGVEGGMVEILIRLWDRGQLIRSSARNTDEAILSQMLKRLVVELMPPSAPQLPRMRNRVESLEISKFREATFLIRSE